ncbi:MAG: hypothetical protein ACXVVQ_03700 [Solirubrobacteraceae bacterium]
MTTPDAIERDEIEARAMQQRHRVDAEVRRNAQLRAVENRERSAIRKRLAAMAAEEREMERAMRAFEEDADQAKRYIKAESRKEHWGHDSERPLAWEVESSRR